jgi:hypothetical protein
MTTLNIYGDSFTDPLGTDKFGLASSSWPYLLRNHYSVNNYGQKGASLVHAYEQFKQTYKQADHAVFIATSPSRWPRPVAIKDTAVWLNNVGSIEAFERLNPKDIDIETRHLLNALKEYYTWLADWDASQMLADFIISDIRRLKPDTIIIPIGFYTQTNPRPWADAGMNASISMRDWIELMWMNIRPGINPFDYELDEQHTVCHLSPEVNQVFAQAVQTAISSGVWRPTIPTSIPHEHPWEYYCLLRG